MSQLTELIVSAKVDKFPGPGGWHFVSLNTTDSETVRKARHAKRIAWGYVMVQATLGETSWATTLFPAKGGRYFLAIKAAVRSRERVGVGDAVKVRCVLR